MPLTLTVLGPAADVPPDGPPPPPPEVFAALLSASAPAPAPAGTPPPPSPSSSPTPTPTLKASTGPKKLSAHEVPPDPAEDGDTSAAALPPTDAAAIWLLAIGMPPPALVVHASGADGTTPLPSVSTATAVAEAKASATHELGSLPQPAGAPADLTPHGHAPPETVSLPANQRPGPEPAITPAGTSLPTAADPAALGLGATAPAGAAHEVDRADALTAVRPALVAAAETLRTEGGRTSLVIRLDPPELGALLVRMTVRDGQVELTVRAPDAAAHGGLLAQTADLQQVLRDAGLDLTSYDVSYGGLTGDDRGDKQGPPERGTPRSAGTADGTVHVTDDVPDPQPAGTWL